MPVHRWVPWIAGFSANFVDDCLDAYLPESLKSACVLDPFAGVGTTLVAGSHKGHCAVGFDINPYAVLASRAKLGAMAIDIEAFDRELLRYETAPLWQEGSAPPAFKSRIAFFSPSVEPKVHAYLAFVKTIGDSKIADLFRVALGATMVSFSNYSYEPSLSTRPGAGKPLIEEAEVKGTMSAKLRQIRHDICWLKSELLPRRQIGLGSVHHDTFMNAARYLPPSSVDLAVTSPPYMNNYHYLRNTRPQLHWLELVTSAEEAKTVENLNLGTYWQTVRDQPQIELRLESRELSELIDELRHVRVEKGAYGGPGWANYVAQYMNDSFSFLQTLHTALQRGAYAVIVIGNSIIQGKEVKVECHLAEMAERIGYSVAGVERVRTKRVGASITQSKIRRGEVSQASLYESALVLRRA